MTVDKKIYLISLIFGTLTIVTAISVIVGILLNFDYTLPHISFEDNFNYLSDSPARQILSGTIWIICGLIILSLILFYQLQFRNQIRLLRILSMLLLLTTAFSFFRAGVEYYKIVKLISVSSPDLEINPQTGTIKMLELILDVKILCKIGITGFGAYTFLIGFIGFQFYGTFFSGRFLAVPAGLLLIIFTWIDPEHIVFNAALAASLLAHLLTGRRFFQYQHLPDKNTN